MTKEALKLALEALEEATDAIDSWGSYASGYFQVKHDLENDISKAKSAITAIKEALAQQEHEPVAFADGTFNHNCPLGAPLYTTPPQRKPLTNEEITQAFNKAMAERPKDASNAETNRLFVRAIEAAHNIK